MKRITLLVLALVSAPMVVLAQGADDTKAQAKAAFIKGREAFAAGNFKDALDNFEKADTLRPHPLMAFNIAQVFETMDDLPGAIAAYSKYLASKPGDAAEVTKKVNGMKATLATWPVVALTSTPAGATVWLGTHRARAKGNTPLTLPVPPRAIDLTLEAEGYEPLTQKLEYPAKSQQALALTLQKILPVVQVKSEPAGAQVSVDGQPPLPGGTPLLVRAEVGPHTLKIQLKGFETVEQAVELTSAHTKAAPLALDIKMAVAKPKGVLVVEVDQAAAAILVDGRAVGQSPLPGPLSLDEGVHRIRVEPAVGDPYEEMVAIKADQTTTTSIELGGGGFEINQRVVSYSLMGLGGAALIGGGVVALLANGAKGDFDDCDSDPACARTDKQAQLADDVSSQALTADILLGAGFAIAATGAVLFFLDDDDPQVGVVPTEGGAAAFGAFRF